MDIYIRTGQLNTAGIKFINKQTWGEKHDQPDHR